MNNTLANGLTLLELLSSTAESFSVTGLARRLDAPKSHVHRLLQTLVEHGYAVQDEDRRYRIGLQPLVVSSALLANHPLRRIGRPRLHELAQATGMDAILTIPRPAEGAGLVLASVYPAGRQRDPAAAIGNRLRGGTATAALYTALVADFAGEPISAARRKRIARDDTARKTGGAILAIATAIRDSEDEVVAAIGCSGPAERVDLAAAAIHLRRATAAIRDELPAVALA